MKKEDEKTKKNNYFGHLTPNIAAVLLITAGILLLIVAVQSVSITEEDIEKEREKNDEYQQLTQNLTAKEIKSYNLTCGSIGIIICIFSFLSAITIVKKKNWKIALMGGVLILGFAVIYIHILVAILALLAVILVLMSKKDFT